MRRLPVRDIAFFLLAISIQTACTVIKPQANTLSEPATIKFSVPSETKEYYSKKVEVFKQIEPNITVELQSNQSQDIDVQEISWLDTQNGSSKVLDLALDLNPFIQQEQDFNRDDFFPGLLDAFNRDGKQLALPNGVDPFVLFYNKNLFDSRGIPYPSVDLTWDQFKLLAMQLRDPGAKTYGYLPMADYVDAIFFAYQHGANILGGDRPQLDSIESREALEWYASLYSDSGVAPNAAQLDSDFGDRGIYAAVYQGLAGMWISQFSLVSQFSDNRIPYKVGIAPLPQDKINFTAAQIQGLVISSQTKHPEAAWRWVRFLNSQTQPWSVPARRSMTESEQFVTELGEDKAEIARSVVQNASLISSFDMERFQAVMQPYLSAVAQTVDGMLPPADTLAEAQRQVEYKLK